MNGTFIFAHGDAPAPFKLTISPQEADSKVAEVLLAMRSSEGRTGGKFLVDLINETSWARCSVTERGWTAALENNTTSVDDTANGGSGNSAKIDGASANVGVHLRRVRLTRTTKLDSLRGREYVVLRLRTSAASSWQIQLKAAPSLADPAPYSEPAVTHDTSSATAFGYVEIPLGFIEIPEESDVALSGAALEIWASRLSGTGDLYMNFVQLLPASAGTDVLTRILVPPGATDQISGSKLATPVTSPGGGSAGAVIDNRALQLNHTSDNAGIPPNAGTAHGQSLHIWRWQFSRLVQASATVLLRIRNITAGTDLATKTVTLSSKALVHDIAAVIPNGNLYQAQVDDPSDTDTLIESVRHQYAPAVGQNEAILTDPLRGSVEKLGVDGGLSTVLAVEGEVPFWIPPGLAAVFVVPIDVPKQNYSEGESVKTRTLTVAPVYAPRYYH